MPICHMLSFLLWKDIPGIRPRRHDKVSTVALQSTALGRDAVPSTNALASGNAILLLHRPHRIFQLPRSRHLRSPRLLATTWGSGAQRSAHLLSDVEDVLPMRRYTSEFFRCEQTPARSTGLGLQNVQLDGDVIAMPRCLCPASVDCMPFPKPKNIRAVPESTGSLNSRQNGCELSTAPEQDSRLPPCYGPWSRTSATLCS